MRKYLFLSLLLALVLTGCNKKPENIIKVPVPARPAGQTDVLGLTAEPIETVHIGVVGLGMRGSEAIRRLAQLPGAEITALCDLLPDRVESAQAQITGLGKPEPLRGWEGYWSRRINEEHRLVYKLVWANSTDTGDTRELFVVQCATHYE